MTKPSNILDKILSNFFSRVLLKDDGNVRIKYSDIKIYSETSAFQSTKRALVLCLVNNDIGGVAGYLSLLAAGAVPMMANTTLSVDAIERIALMYQPDFVWIPESLISHWPKSLILASLHGYFLLALSGKYKKSCSPHPELALLLSTSGSTGASKYVRLSYKNIWSNAASIANYLGLTDSELPITTLPLNYSYGLSVIHSHIWVGATLAVTDKSFFDKTFWNFIRESGATSMAGVPYHYEMLKKLRFCRMDLPCLRTLTQAGGRMDPELTREFAQHCASHGMRFFTMYGQTEATARMSYVPPEQAVAKAATVGVPIPEGFFELHNENGTLVSTPDTTGELVYRGPNVCMGYAENRSDLSLGDVNQGVLKTGDLAQFDVDGYYSIIGRKKRFIKLYGIRINLQEVEEYLEQQGHLTACAGEDNRLEVFVENSESDQAYALKQKLTNWLQVSSAGLYVYGLRSFPRSDAGKILYSELHSENAKLLT